MIYTMRRQRAVQTNSCPSNHFTMSARVQGTLASLVDHEIVPNRTSVQELQDWAESDISDIGNVSDHFLCSGMGNKSLIGLQLQ